MDESNPTSAVNSGESNALATEPGCIEKLCLVFSNPIKLFESLKRKSSWLPPLILLILVSTIIGVIVQPHIMSSMRQDTLTFLSSIPNIPDSAVEKATEGFDKAEQSGIVRNIGLGLLGGLVMRGVLFFLVVTIIFLMGTIFFGGTAKYIKVMSMYAWVTPIWILNLILATPLMIIKETHAVSLSPAVLITPDVTNPMFFFLKNLNIFSIWAVILLGVGFSVIYGVSKAKGIVLMLLIWGIWIAISSFVPFLNFQAYMMGLT